MSPSAAQSRAGGVTINALLEVWKRAGVAAGRVVDFHLLTGVSWSSSGDDEPWNYRELSDKHETFQGSNEEICLPGTEMQG